LVFLIACFHPPAALQMENATNVYQRRQARISGNEDGRLGYDAPSPEISFIA
jgi:hypothetical protein